MRLFAAVILFPLSGLCDLCDLCVRNSGPVLADVPQPAANELGSWLFCLVCILTLIALGKSIFVRKPSVETEFATKSELASLRLHFDGYTRDLSGKMDEMRADINAQGERRSIALHERINDIAEAVARVDERTRKP